MDQPIPSPTVRPTRTARIANIARASLAASLLLSGCALQQPWLADQATSDPDAFVGPEPVAAPRPLVPFEPVTARGDAALPGLLNSAPAPVEAVFERMVVVEAENAEPGDLWERVRAGMALPDRDHPRVQADLDWYARHPAYLDRVAERANYYLYHILEQVEARGIPTEIALLPVVESAFNAFAYSHGRASGIWQFIPATGARYGLKQNWWYDGRRDILASTQAALNLLQDLHEMFGGDWLLALAAYNSGAGTVSRAIRRNEKRGKPTDFWSLDLPHETRGYVPKLLAISSIVLEPQVHGVDLMPIPDEPYFARIDIPTQLDLAKAAELADIDINEVYLLNPGFNQWATDPQGPYYLLVPMDNAIDFIDRLTALAADEYVRWVRHKVRSGETLGTIADRYNTSVGTLQRVNRINGHVIRADHHLLIPVASRAPQTYRLSAEQRQRAIQNTPRGGSKVVHIVRSGDTLWELSRKHGVSHRQLAKWNGMAPRDPLMPGQRLVIWSRTSTSSSSYDPADVAAPPQRQVTQRIGYRVRQGDSLAAISRRFNVTVTQLVKWNSISPEKYLQPGQRLTLYVDVTRQTGS